MKKITLVISVGIIAISCKNPLNDINKMYSDEVKFIASFDKETKVTTVEGKSSWDAADQISVFSVRTDGTIADINKQYSTTITGNVGYFNAVGDAITASDKYYAFFPGLEKYPSNLNANEEAGFSGVSVGDAIIDHRFMPVCINSGCTLIIEPETGKTLSGSDKFFYSVGDAPDNISDPVSLSFSPIMPILELGIRGMGTVKSVKLAYTDKATDVLSGNNWLSGKGIFNMVTGTLYTTNSSSSAYCTLTINLKESDAKPYVELDTTKPLRFQFATGRFTITKGLTLTITDKDGIVTTKTIWADKTVSSMDGNKCKHIYQPLVIPFISTSAVGDSFDTSGGSVSIIVNSSSDWTVNSKPDWVDLSAYSGVNGATLTITAVANTGTERSGSIVISGADGASCMINVSQNGNAVTAADYYSVNPSYVDWSISKVYFVQDSESETIAIITNEVDGFHAYPVISSTPDYSSGVAISASAYVKADASTILTEAPETGTISAAALSAMTLVSDVKTHGVVKIGESIWLAENYKTTKLKDGTVIPVCTPSSMWTSGQNGYIVISEEYLYSGWTLGFNTASPASFDDTIFAPEGWAIASRNDWAAAFDILGTFSEACNGVFGANGNTPMQQNATTKYLGYFAIRTCTPGTGTNSYMCGIKNTNATINSAQALNNGLPVRLVKK